MDDVERLLAYEAIRQLAARYALATDARDLDALVGLFVDDVRVGRDRIGRAALREAFDASLRGIGISILNVGTHVIELVDADHATGHVYCKGEIQDGDRWIHQGDPLPRHVRAAGSAMVLRAPPARPLVRRRGGDEPAGPAARRLAGAPRRHGHGARRVPDLGGLLVLKTALVTGATRGIGRATAVALARRGYDVAVTGRTRHEGDAPLPGSLDSVAEAIEDEGRRAVPIVLDLLDAEALVPAAGEAIERLGHVDVALSNAIHVGPASSARFLDTPPDELARCVFGDLTAHLLLIQPLVRHMVERGTGVVAFTTSAAGVRPVRRPVGEGGWALAYGVAKAGLGRVPEQLAVEHPGIRAYGLQPGPVATERVLADEALAFVARRGAPVDTIGEACARILDAPAGTFPNGATIEVQEVARREGLLP